VVLVQLVALALHLQKQVEQVEAEPHRQSAVRQ
jgi:hypothetical protein